MSANNIILQSYGPYNHRRYGKPWGARIILKGVTPEYVFSVGNYAGTDMGGEVLIQAAPGWIIAFGQKDHRNTRKTANDWYLVGEDMTLTSISRADAIRHLMGQAQERQEVSHA